MKNTLTTSFESSKICLVNYEEPIYNGILSKFAYKMDEELKKMGFNSYVKNRPDPDADINHHINYLPYKQENSPDSINTLMVTHIFNGYKFDTLKGQMKTADCGICMSSDTKKSLIAR